MGVYRIRGLADLFDEEKGMKKQSRYLSNKLTKVITIMTLAIILPAMAFMAEVIHPISVLGFSTNITTIHGAAVFNNFQEAGDLLFCFEIENTRLPWYPIENPERIYDIQILDTDNSTILAFTTLKMWKYAPESIYLSADGVAGFTQDKAYIIRMISKLGTSNNTTYTLTTNDWRGSDKTGLDSWAIGVATNMATYDGGTLTDYVTYSTGQAQILTEKTGAIFEKGISGIYKERPNLFQASEQNIADLSTTVKPDVWEDKSWETQFGTSTVSLADSAGAIFGVTNKQALSGFFILLFVGVVIWVISNKSPNLSPIMVVALAFPLLAFLASEGGLLNFKFIQLIVFVVGVVLPVWALVWSRT